MRAAPPVRRAIAVMLAGCGVEAIEDLRRRYDPLAALLPAHLTLVFPFESALPASALAAHVRAVAAGRTPFPLALREVTGHDGEYLFLNVKCGNDELIALHDGLYTGLLAPYLEPDHTFLPHATVGRLPDAASFRAALADARRLDLHHDTVVRDICAYTIAPDGSRTIVCRVSLGG
jgi:2'-5' RNA ligase